MSKTYEDLLAEIAATGEERTDRTGTGTLSLFSPHQLRYNLRNHRVPLITSKSVPWRMALREFMWMLSGSTNTNDLESPAMKAIWDKWAGPDGSIGPTYGAQYRNAGGSAPTTGPNFAGWPERYQSATVGIDQLATVINQLVDTPDTRRAIISLWSVPELGAMALEPCMVLFQFSLRGPNMDQLDLHVYQRSADMMLGVPFDLFQGGVLAHLVARELSFKSGRYIEAQSLTWSAGDAHIYLNQIDAVHQVLLQSQGAPKMRAKLRLPNNSELSILDGSLTSAHIDVEDYFAAPPVSAPIAV